MAVSNPNFDLGRPRVLIDTDIPRRVGVSVEIDRDASANQARRYKMGEAVIGLTILTATAQRIETTLDGKPAVTSGDANEWPNGIEARLHMGSILKAARGEFDISNGKDRDLEQIASAIASGVMAHEIKHASDIYRMGRARLEREDKWFERRRLAKVALPRIGAAAGAMLMGGVGEAALAFSGAAWYIHGLFVGYYGTLAALATREGRKAHKEAKKHKYVLGEKTYIRHPYERRAFKAQAAYRRDLALGKVPLLVNVKVVNGRAFSDSIN